ncbi:hypothetical protein [Paenibacillus sp. BAC0078]
MILNLLVQLDNWEHLLWKNYWKRYLHQILIISTAGENRIEQYRAAVDAGKLRTLNQLAEIVSGVLEQEIQLQNVNDETYAEILRGTGLSDFLTHLLTDMQKSLREGALAFEGNDLEKLLGRELQPLSEGIRAISEK